LSEIKLSAFIIVVFSKQKGLTLVFRNDPLESLKVSSTFDSIQFVRDYLQRTIEGKLRDLMMDELPAIIHRLSLQLWCPDQIPKNDVKEDSEPAINPLATPPLDAVDANGHLLDSAEISNLSLDGGPEIQSLFSQKNLIRLAALTNSHRTLSLFTPGIEDITYRAKAGPVERPDANVSPPLTTPTLRSHSYQGSATTYTFSDTSSQDQGNLPSRPSLVSLHSATTGLSLGSGRHSKTGRKKKTRVVNLRRKAGSEASGEFDNNSELSSETASTTGPMSEPIMSSSIPEAPEDENLTPTTTPSKVRFRAPVDMTQAPPRSPLATEALRAAPSALSSTDQWDATVPIRQPHPVKERSASKERSEENDKKSEDRKDTTARNFRARRGPQSDTSSTILEQAWIAKMAGEIARRVYDEKNRNPAFWDEREDSPPPAYESS
jgi:mitochondrial distribution and morphology protein 34